MLIKEYRIGLPMTVAEYRIAQLYMIQKKSREESSGSGSGVEIRVNEPYTNGPGGDGQYTQKIYHIGSHLPGWFRAILPKSALRVEEEAWNAYPYTRTIYRCPFIEKFSIEIETRYLNDGGQEDNLFNLSAIELRSRVVDYLDIVKDPISSGDYRKEEDPKLFCSETTGRGPLTDTWWKTHKEDMAAGHQDRIMMTAYKLCKVEFKYWGMQSRIERFIHDIGLRKTMLRAHRQAWCWQDEYNGLTIDDIRRLEYETQLALEEKMAAAAEEGKEPSSGKTSRKFSLRKSGSPKKDSLPMKNGSNETLTSQSTVTEETVRSKAFNTEAQRVHSKTSLTSVTSGGRRNSWSSARSKLSVDSRNLPDWRVESLEQLQTSSSDEEYFDAMEDGFDNKSGPGLFKSSSMELITVEDNYLQLNDDRTKQGVTCVESTPLEKRIDLFKRLQNSSMVSSLESSAPPSSPSLASSHSQACNTTVLFLVVHAGSIMDTGAEYKVSRHADMTTLRATIDTVLHAHYPSMIGRVAVRMVPCSNISLQALSLLVSICPYSFDAQSPSVDSAMVANENFPLAAVPLLSTSSPDYMESVTQLSNKLSQAYREFLHSDDGACFNGQVCIIGDSLGSTLTYDVLCRQSSHAPATPCIVEDHASEEDPGLFPTRNESSPCQSKPELMVTDTSEGLECPSDADKLETVPQISCQATRSSGSRRTSTGSQGGESSRLGFEVTDFFMLGSPLGLLLAQRRLSQKEEQNSSPPRPICAQVYNLFYPSDPSAFRLEPMLQERFKLLSPVKIPRYQRFPLGDGQSVHVD